MGAQQFVCIGEGATVAKAFQDARTNAIHEHGHGGYSGSIAEKNSYRLIQCEQDDNAVREMVGACLDDEEHFCQDKCGPAGAIRLSKSRWAFFGWASS